LAPNNWSPPTQYCTDSKHSICTYARG